MKTNKLFRSAKHPLRFLYVCLTASVLAYLITLSRDIYSEIYPAVRFYGKFIFIVAVIPILLKFLLTKKIPHHIPMLTSFSVFLIYVLFHHVFFSNGVIDIYVFNLVMIYVLALSMVIYIREKEEFFIIYGVIWFLLFTNLIYFYSIVLLQSDEFIKNRINAENYSEINLNTISFMALFLVLTAVRLRELSVENRIAQNLTFAGLMLSLLLASLIVLVNQSFTAITLLAGTLLILFLINFHLIKLRLLLYVCLVIVPLQLAILNYPDITDLVDLLLKRIESGGSGEERIKSAKTLLDKFSHSPVFGNNAEFIINDGSGSSNHTFYLNILGIYGVFGFLLFSVFIINIILVSSKSQHHSSLLSKILLLGIWVTAPTTYLQAISLIIIFEHYLFPRINQKAISCS